LKAPALSNMPEAEHVSTETRFIASKKLLRGFLRIDWKQVFPFVWNAGSSKCGQNATNFVRAVALLDLTVVLGQGVSSLLCKRP
jgi:hypothetical protein